MRRSLLPSQPLGSGHTGEISKPRLSLSAAPRQPLAAVPNNANNNHAQPTGHTNKRLSAVYNAPSQQQQQQQQHSEYNERPAKVARLAPPSVPVPPSAATPSSAPTADSRPGYNVQLLTARHGEEMSFEEIRAKHAKYAYKRTATPAPSSNRKSVHVPAPSSVSKSPISSSFTPEHSAILSLTQPSPTMCTRAAMNDIEAMFKDSPVTPGAGLANRGPPSSGVSFSTRSLTSEIPPMSEAAAMNDMAHRGRPSPVAFSVFTDEELMTRNIAAQAAAARQQQGSGVTPSFGATSTTPAPSTSSFIIYADPDVENRAPTHGSMGGGSMRTGAVRRPLAAREDESVSVSGSASRVATNDEEEEDDDDNATGNTYQHKSYPPLTPIMETSHESDMSHVSNNSTTAHSAAPTPAVTREQPDMNASAIAAATPAPTQTSEATTAGESNVPTLPDGVLDSFDVNQRIHWINELGLLSAKGVADLTSGNATMDMEALANGKEDQVEIGEKIFQISRVLHAESNGASVLLLGEDLVDGEGEVQLRIGVVSDLWEHGLGSNVLSNLIARDPNSEKLIRNLFLAPTESIVYADRCISVAPVGNGGVTMADLLKLYAKNSTTMDERLVVFYCHEMLKLIQILHMNAFIHNNIQPHHVWLRYNDASSTPLSDVWDVSGGNGWEEVGLALGGFSAAIDRSLFNPDTKFTCTSAPLTTQHPCVAMVQKVLGIDTWIEAPDLIGLISLAAQMIWGLGTEFDLARDTSTGLIVVNNTRTSISSKFSKDIFIPFFDAVLNFHWLTATATEVSELTTSLMQHFETAMTLEAKEGEGPIMNHIKPLLIKQQMMMLGK